MGHCDACHTIITYRTLVEIPGSGIKADQQALHASEYHDSLMSTQDAMSDDYAPGTTSSEECARPTKVGSKN